MDWISQFQLLNLIDLVLNSVLMAMYFTISYLFYQGLIYAKKEGKLMLRAITVFFSVAGFRYMILIILDAVAIEQQIEQFIIYEPYVWRVVSEFALAVAAMYFLYAVIKKNTPDDELLVKPKRG